VTRAEKRRRKKENTRAAREAREARMKREKRKSIALRVGAAVLLVAAAVGIGAIVTGGDEEDGDAAGGTTTTAPEATTAAPASLPNGCIDKAPEPVENRPTFDSPPEMTIDTAKTYTAKIETSCGYITVSLDDDHAPTGVNNFVTLARAGFYDGLTWHRVVTDFVIQGGDPEGTGSGGPGYQVETELPPDGEYPLGSLAWAKAPNDAAGTAGSQFFIVTGENGTTLPAEYGYFGKVTEGLENAQKIESLAQGDGPPSIPMYIYSIEIVES
jgi:cyclophilin family peptidyl-prolyl cis-trans isomerase